MMGMRPNHGMPNMGGGFNPNMAGYQHMFQGMPPGGPGMPPGHFRNRFDSRLCLPEKRLN